jgi:hypothetical protein
MNEAHFHPDFFFLCLLVLTLEELVRLSQDIIFFGIYEEYIKIRLFSQPGKSLLEIVALLGVATVLITLCEL